VYLKTNDEYLLTDWTCKGRVIPFPIFVLLKPVGVQVFDRHIISVTSMAYPHTLLWSCKKGRLQEKVYTFPGKLSNFPYTREVREAAGEAEGTGPDKENHPPFMFAMPQIIYPR